MSNKRVLSDSAIYLYIDESQVGDHGEPDSCLYLCISLILSEDFDEIESELNTTKKIFTNDQFMGVSKKSLDKLLHYNDDNDEVKLKFADVIRMFFFKSYIAVKRFDDDSYENTYYILLEKLLKHRIIRYKDREIFIRYEQNSKISKSAFSSSVNKVLDDIVKDNKHVIKKPPVIEEISKNDLMVSLPDYSMGLYLSYKKEKEKEKEKILYYKIVRFEKIRSKIRLLVDIDTSTYYSRKSGNTL